MILFLLLTIGLWGSWEVTLEVDAYPIGRTVNTERTITYWVVEFSGKDCAGNVHRRREEVDIIGSATEEEVISIGNQMLLDRVIAGDKLILGFLEAIECDSSNISL